MAWGDRLAVLDLGRIVQVGTPREVYNHPASTFVARLLGATNLMQGRSTATTRTARWWSGRPSAG